MPIYQYKARDEEGRLISGKVDVSGEQELAKRLEDSGFFLVKFTLEKRNPFNEDIAKKFTPITLKNLYTLTLQLSNTVSTGVPLLSSLVSIAKGCKNRKLASVLDIVSDDIKNGSSFSEALGRHPGVFSKFYVSMVELGESSGTLPKILYGLAEYIKKEMQIRQRIVSAITYPVILCLVATGLVFYVLTFVMPQFIKIFTEEKLVLPLPTLILVNVSNFLVNFWYLILILIAGAIVGLRLFMLSDYGRLTIDTLKLKIPVIGEVIKKICAKRFIDGLFLLYSSGLPILKALNIIKSIMRNKYFEGIIDALGVHISVGKDLASYLSLTDLFSPDILSMIKSGEESGNLQKMLEKSSDIYEDEVNSAIEVLISFFEIGVIILMGVGVGFIAMAVLFPMFNLGQAVKSH